MKKIFLTVTAILIAFNLIMPPHVADASIATKPLTIAAKKAAKDVAKNTAVEMANQIVSEFLVKELIEGVQTDQGYSPVCMDGSKQSIKDCPVDKRAQIKTNLSQTDKSNLSKKVESVLEKKTLTSSKWGKFLDFFVPIFIISGAVSLIEASMDGDMLSFFDEIGQESLIELGLLKPLLANYDLEEEILDFSKHVLSAEFSVVSEDSFDISYSMNVLMLPNASMTYTHVKDTNGGIRTKNVTTGFSTKMRVGKGSISIGTGADKRYFGFVKINGVQMFDGSFYNSGGSSLEIFRSSVPQETSTLAIDDASSWIKSNIGPSFLNVKDINKAMNAYINTMNINPSIQWKFSNITMTKPTPPDIKTDYGNQTATDKIKNPNGTVNIKGQDSFIFTYGDTHIYPSDQSNTGWKDKTTGEDITVVEDDIIVQDKTEGEDEIPPDEKPPSTDDGLPPDKDKNKKKLEDESKKLGNLVTTRFPFSLPWDFIAMIKLIYADPMTPKWEVRGTDKIPLNFDINLSFLDPYISWFRGFILIGFVISVIFMHGRFMGGSQ